MITHQYTMSYRTLTSCVARNVATGWTPRRLTVWRRTYKLTTVNTFWGQQTVGREASTLTTVDNNIVKSTLNVNLDMVPLTEYVWNKFEAFADKVAIECSVSGRRYAFSDVMKHSRRLAASLQRSFGLQPGDIVMLVLPNLPEYPIVLYGSLDAGLVPAPVPAEGTVDELVKFMQTAPPKLIVTTVDKYAKVMESLARTQKKTPVVVIRQSNNESYPGGCIKFEELVSDQKPENKRTVPRKPQDAAVLPFSSGTTGLPKAIEMSHGGLVSVMQLFSHPEFCFFPHPGTDSSLGILPFFHIYGFLGILTYTMTHGNKVVCVPRFDPQTYVSTIKKHQITILFQVPPLIMFLGGHPGVTADDLASVRLVSSGAAPCGATDLDRLQTKLRKDSKLIQLYGLTEFSLISHQGMNRTSDRASVGIVLPNTELKVVDVDGKGTLATGQSGEIYAKGPQMMKGYFNNDKANKEIFEDGWLRSGDIGYYNEEGEIFIVDRLKELIKVKGYQVAPAELEEVLRTHPQIADAAVIGVPDGKTGEKPKAFVVLRADAAIKEEDVQNYLAEKVSKHKHLTGGVVFLTTIPKSLSGKILRKNLKQI